MAAAKGDNLPPIIVKKVTVVEGGHHGGAWKVAYADFVTAMMAFFLLMWLLGATTEDQRRGLADYFTPTLVKIKDSGAGANGLLSGASLTDVDDYPNRQGQTGNKGLTVPRDAMGGPREAARMIERITSRTKDRLEKDPRLAKLMSQIKMVDTTEGVRATAVCSPRVKFGRDVRQVRRARLSARANERVTVCSFRPRRSPSERLGALRRRTRTTWPARTRPARTGAK